MRILVAEARDPWVPAAPQVPALVDLLRARGHDVEIVSLPSGRGESPASAASAWRLLELSSSNARPVDLLIAAGFPTYFARHPRKVAWLIGDERPPRELDDIDARARSECHRVVAGQDAIDVVEDLLG